MWSGDKNHGDITGSGSLYINTTSACIMNRIIGEDTDCAVGGFTDGIYYAWFYDPGDVTTRAGLMLAFYNDSGVVKGRAFVGATATSNYRAGRQSGGSNPRPSSKPAGERPSARR